MAQLVIGLDMGSQGIKAVGLERAMRGGLKDVGFAIMVATMLHSVATGNILPASIPLVCVDINPSTAIKLADRGSFQTVGLVTDVGPFLRALVEELEVLRTADGSQG